jgi:hypothetical protein
MTSSGRPTGMYLLEPACTLHFWRRHAAAGLHATRCEDIWMDAWRRGPTATSQPTPAEPSNPSWAILVRTSVVVRRSWSTYATDTAPSVRSATAPLGPEQGIRAQPDRPRGCPCHGALSSAPQTRDLMQVHGPHACGAYWHARAARATMTGWLVMTTWPTCVRRS